MSIDDLRALFTVASLIAFIAIVWWAYDGRRKQDFEQAALLPFTAEDSLDAALEAPWHAQLRDAERKSS